MNNSIYNEQSVMHCIYFSPPDSKGRSDKLSLILYVVMSTRLLQEFASDLGKMSHRVMISVSEEGQYHNKN